MFVDVVSDARHAIILLSWFLIPTTSARTGFTFDGEDGECFQYQVFLNGDSESFTEYSNVSILSYKIKLPQAQNLQIDSGPVYYNSSIQGNATFIINDTDSGTISIK